MMKGEFDSVSSVEMVSFSIIFYEKMTLKKF